jgi:lipoprotein-anchoring transpeptidase ErfK/SrfK
MHPESAPLDPARRKFLRRLFALAGASTLSATNALFENSPASALDSETQEANAAQWIEVILSTQRLRAWEGSSVVIESLCSTGLPRTPTVRGSYRVYTKLVSTRMRGPGYDLRNVPHTMYFYRGYAIHGAYWHNKFGRPMSHGCVNLPLPVARQVFNWAHVGIPVRVRA